MNRFKSAGIALGLVLVLVACNPIKFISKKVEQIMVVAQPDKLEVHGNNVAYELKGKFPPKVFHRKAYVTLTPILTYNGKTLKLDAVKYRGEKTEGTGKVISFKEGGSFSCAGTFEFDEAMEGKDAILSLEIEVCKDENTCKTFTKENLAQGVITTSRLITNDDEVFFAGFGKDDNGAENGNSVGNITRNFKRTIFFELNRWDVRTSEKKSDRMNELWDFVKTPRMELKGINVNSYASPDGELKLNQNLTDKRSESTYSFLFKELKGLKLGVDQSNLYKRQAMEEDWAGLKRLVSVSNIEDKTQALQIINSSKSNDDKEADLRKLASWETILKDIMPELRRSDVQLQGKIANRSVTELKELAKTSYDGFNTKELLIYAASTKDLKTKKDVYKAFIKARPKSIIGYNNLAACLILEGDLSSAEKQLDLAKSECGDNDSLYKNFGVVYRRNGNTEAATNAYARAAKTGISTGYNQALIDVINGDYTSASANMPSNACGGNAALVAMLSGNVSSSGDKVKCDNNISALEYYVAAVAYARQKNIEYMAVNLKSAIDKDKSLADKATNDLEFSSYWDSAEFKNAVNH